MNALTLTLTSANGPYNVYNILTGVQTSGVTPPSGVPLYKTGMPVTSTRLNIINEGTGIIRVGNSAVSISSPNGEPVQPQAKWPFYGDGVSQTIGLIATWVAVHDASHPVTFLWE